MHSDGSCTASPCATTIAERPRYFPRQLVTPDDLNLQQDYFRDKMRRHNRLLHGWGVVCGARVCLVPASDASGASSFEPWSVAVSPGYVLGPYGDEILLDCCRTVDLRTRGTTGVTGDPCSQASDPWCTDVIVKRDPTAPLYVAVKYKECKTRPVRVQPMGCGCDDTSCEYSRWRDGYEIGILTDCPTSHVDPPKLDDLGRGPTPICPECPKDPWVVLARVVIDADGTVTGIDNCACRRLVLSFASFWWTCPSGPSITAVTPPAGQILQQGMKNVTIAVVGAHIDAPPAVKADLGDGVTVTSIAGGGAAATLVIDIGATAATGPHTLTIINGDGSGAAFAHAITIAAGPTPSPTPLPPAPPPPPPAGPGEMNSASASDEPAPPPEKKRRGKG